MSASDDPNDIGTWAQGTRAVVRALRALADDATLPQGERVHSRRYLRRMLLRRLREIEARLDDIDPVMMEETPRRPAPSVTTGDPSRSALPAVPPSPSTT